MLDNPNGWSNAGEWSPSEEDLVALARGLEHEEVKGLTTDDGLIIPDFLLNPNSTTIIYTIDNKLYTARGNITHRDVEFQIIKHDKDFARHYNEANRHNEHELNVPLMKRMHLQKYAALYGRAGIPSWDDGRFVVAFWNDTPEIYDKLLVNCLKALEDKDILPDDMPVEIHTPLDIKDYKIGVGETKQQQETTPEQQRRYELQRRMHLATGNEKKEIRKELGLWTDKKVKHPWQRELEKASEIGPGQKWWAPQSEQIENIARVISEDL